MSRKLSLIGIGAGNPDWMTLAGVKALQALDVLFVVIKENNLDELVDIRRLIVEQHRQTKLETVELFDPPRPWQTTDNYPEAVKTWRRARKQQWSKAIADHLADGQNGGFLVWGDPSLYESTLAIIKQAIAESDISLEVIPGVSSVLALAAAHQIPLNRQGRAVQITPARRILDAGGLPEGVDDAVVMLDGKQTFAKINPDGIDIYWGAYLGTPDQILIAGDLAEMRDEILARRAEAARRKGWVFDTYLLRRR